MSHQHTEQIEEISLKKYESLLDIVVIQENEKQNNAQGASILSQQKHTQQLMTLVLLETLHEEDDAFFDDCFEVQVENIIDEHLVDSTVKAMIGNDTQKIQILAEQIQKRLHQTGKAIQIWFQALLKYQGNEIVTAQLEQFNGIKGQLQGNWDIGRKTRLRGKIDMVLTSRRTQKQAQLEEFDGYSQTGSSGSKEQENHQRKRQNDWQEEEEIEDESSRDDEEDEENIEIEESQKQLARYTNKMKKEVQESDEEEEDDNLNEEDSDYLEI